MYNNYTHVYKLYMIIFLKLYIQISIRKKHCCGEARQASNPCIKLVGVHQQLGII